MIPATFVRSLYSLLILALVAAAGPAYASERILSFEDRVSCQEAIERVYYSHQIGATRSFEEAVPQAVIEKRVRTYLQQSLALERWWKTPVTAQALERELERIATNTRLPERLLEVYGALGRDSVLIQECLARPALVNRLARSFFAKDERIHGRGRREAEGVRERLASGLLDPRAVHPQRSELELVREDDGKNKSQPRLGFEIVGALQDRPLVLSASEFESWRRRAPEEAGEIGEVLEERERFVVTVVLEEGPGKLHLAVYTVLKERWDTWWRQASLELDAERAGTAAVSLAHLPEPSATGQAEWEPPEDWELEAGSNSGAPSPCRIEEAWRNGVLDDPFAYRARNDHTAVWTGSVMIVWGGSPVTNSGGRYDPLTDTWTSTTTVGAPSGRHDHTAVWTGGLMVVWGGQGALGTDLRDGGRYDPLSDTWAPTTIANAPQARYTHTAVWTGSLMVVWGGFGGGDYLNTGGRYDPVTDRWKPTRIVNALKPRSGHTAVWTGSLMVVWGGFRLDLQQGGQVFDTGGRYDPLTDTWTPTTTLDAPEARFGHTAVWTGSLMVVWGGALDPSGGRYDPLSDTWSATSTFNAPEARGGHTAVWTGGVMVVWGGGAADGSYLNTGGRYDPVADTWTPTSTENAPEARRSHTAVWTGSLMIVWGGGGLGLNTGGRYDPLSDSWTPTSTGDNPQGRAGHTAVWTGNLMVVWGGYDGSFALDTGGRYDPLTDAWTPTTTNNVPEARSGHTAVWTGSLMVVWGGVYDTTGGRYDPVADTWSPTSIFKAPQLRGGHTAVWTGRVMVVWGGYDGISFLKTGGRYDPVRDAWAPTTTVNAPTQRWVHTAVWTGSQMVVWGGARGEGDFTDYFNTGGRYDPVANTWTPTTTGGAPEPRARHTAVWTGSVMVVWAGNDLHSYFDTGGRYDPVSDTWSPTTTANAPTGRWYHTAVWTGSKMVAWGGEDISGGVNTGGRYDPLADTWRPTTTLNAPEDRYDHTAVWTGSTMLVWGGYNGLFLDTGGRYGPWKVCASCWPLCSAVNQLR